MVAWVAPVIAAAASIASGAMANSAAKKRSREAMAHADAVRQQALAEISGMTPLDIQALQFNPLLQQYIDAPEMIAYDPYQAVSAQTVDAPSVGRDAQMQALQSLQQTAEEGLSPAEQYNYMKNRRQAEQMAQGREQAIMQSLAARGMSGTGIEAAMRMQAAQSEADRLSMAQAFQAAQDQQARANAINQMASLGGQVRAADFGEQRTNTDILNQFATYNSERAREIANRNIDMKNMSAQARTDERRRLEQANVDAQNKAQLMMAQDRQDRDKMRQQSIREQQQMKAQALTGQIPSIYAQGAADADRKRQMWQTIGSGIQSAAGLYGMMNAGGGGGGTSGQTGYNSSSAPYMTSYSGQNQFQSGLGQNPYIPMWQMNVGNK